MNKPMKFSLVLLAAISLTGFASQSAYADDGNGNGLGSSGISTFSAPSILGPVTTGGPWFEFLFGGTDSFATACGGCVSSSGGNSVYADDPPWTFNALSWRKLTVTDAFQRGDQFEVYDYGISIGTTSSVLANPDSCGSDPDVCVGDSTVSHHVFVVGPGDHEITIQAISSPYGGGAAYFRIDKYSFDGTPGQANCHGKSVSALAKQYKGLPAAASALGLPSVQALQDAIKEYCGN